MGAPIGNKNALGNSGNTIGRKSAYEEHQDAAFVSDVWQKSQDVEALEEQIKSKHYSGRDITALRLLKGSERLMAKFMDKLVPDLHEHGGPGGQPLFPPLSREQLMRLANEANEKTEHDAD
jgi:hypothetical protein